MSKIDPKLESDENLLNYWYEGHSFAFNLFFNRHYNKVYSYGIKRGIPHNDMEDVIQEIFFKLHKSIHHYEKGRAALPWFFTIVHNTCIDWLRKNISVLNKNTVLPDELSKIEEDMISDEKLDKVELILKGMKEQERSLFKMRNVEEFSFKEISLKLGKSEVSLRKSYQRILITIKNIVSEKK